MEKGKSSNGLMRHIRNDHQIIISGSPNKIALLNMGYYHGYKRYRYIKFEIIYNHLRNSQRLKRFMPSTFNLRLSFTLF